MIEQRKEQTQKQRKEQTQKRKKVLSLVNLLNLVTYPILKRLNFTNLREETQDYIKGTQHYLFAAFFGLCI